MNKMINLKTIFAITVIFIIIGCFCMNVNAATKYDYSLVFDAKYYGTKYPDLGAAGIITEQQLLEHFLKFGMTEGRQGNEEFNVYDYKNTYVDLQKAYGNDLRSYYIHYIVFGKAEGRCGIKKNTCKTNVVNVNSSSQSAVVNNKKTTTAVTSPRNGNSTANNNSSSSVEYTYGDLVLINKASSICKDGKPHDFVYEEKIINSKEVKVYDKYKCSNCNAHAQKVYVPEPISEEEAYEKIIAMQEYFPTGAVWNSSNSYNWAEPHGYRRANACGGFAQLLNDQAFAYRAYSKHNDIYSVKVGDIVEDSRPGISHAFVVISYDDEYVTIAEGNYSGHVNWGRKIKKSELDGYCTITTRY